MKEVVNTILRSDGVFEIYVGNRLLIEVADGKSDEKFIEDVLYGLGYYWLHDGTIVQRPATEEVVTKQSIYDEMCAVLTEYEDGSDMITENELYAMLVKIQNNWESVITAQEG